MQVNIDDEQVNNVIDDTFQFFQENCYNGMERCYLFHEITADDKTRFAASVTTTTGTTDWKETTNYIPIPSHVTGISKVFGLVSNSIRSNLFGVEYQMFLNDLYAFGSLDILNYYMTKAISRNSRYGSEQWFIPAVQIYSASRSSLHGS